MAEAPLEEREPWSRTDFRINRAFWNYWGSDAALPFRILNLRELLASLQEQGIDAYLYGSTLRDCALRGILGPDHDDDICVTNDRSSVLRVLLTLEDTHARDGFSLIRWDNLISVERYGRYIDIHVLSDAPKGIRAKRIHGHSLPLPVEAERVLQLHDENKKKTRDAGRTDAPSLMQIALSEIVRVRRLRDLYCLGRRVATKLRGLAPRRRQQSRGLRFLTESEFLGLKIDAPTAINWEWRGNHWLAVFLPHETFGQALIRLRSCRLPDAVAPDTYAAFDEPMHLSRQFWKNGNNSLLAPLSFGFRHNVMPYQAANLYINRGIRPRLYTSEYFKSLPKMSDAEIADFLATHPVGVDRGCLTSGRHRATAMFGRLLRGESYIPMTYVNEIN